MKQDTDAFGFVLQQLETLEADPNSAEMIQSAVGTLRAEGITITFEAVLGWLGRYQELSGASMFAALIVREDHRQQITEALAAAPVGTAH